MLSQYLKLREISINRLISLPFVCELEATRVRSEESVLCVDRRRN